VNFGSDHAKGLVLATLGVLVLTPDTLLIRLIDTDQWTMVFWRGLLMGVALIGGSAVVDGGNFFSGVRGLGRTGIAVASAYTVSSFLFVAAVSNTSVANALIIIAASPMFAAFFGWLALKERVPLRTMIAILATMSGIALVVWEGLGQGHWSGEAAALGTAVAMAAIFVMVRRRKSLNMVPAAGWGGLLAALICLMFGLAAPLTIAADDVGWLLVMGLIVLPVSFALITLAPRYLPAPEVGLLLLLETVLGPFWVWLALGEEVGAMALAGGLIVVTTLVIHSVLALRAAKSGDQDGLN
jgi:drug/metabolite transporter (DMT)-like permease